MIIYMICQIGEMQIDSKHRLVLQLLLIGDRLNWITTEFRTL